MRVPGRCRLDAPWLRSFLLNAGGGNGSAHEIGFRRSRRWRIRYPLIVPSSLPYRSRAVRAMVMLHEEHLRRFVQTWRRALATPVNLPSTTDPNYASLEALGRHVLGAAGGYLAWMCNALNLS